MYVKILTYNSFIIAWQHFLPTFQVISPHKQKLHNLVQPARHFCLIIGRKKNHKKL